MRDNEAHVKKQTDEIRKIQKEINPKSAKALYKAYNTDKPNDKIKQLTEAFVGMMLNKANVSHEDVETNLAKGIGIQNWLAKADPLTVSSPVADKHFDTVASITKSFIDSSKENENYKKCSPHAPFLAWTSQYIILVRHSAAEAKVKDSYDAVNRELTQKDQKKLQL